jgi:hypothetical protein
MVYGRSSIGARGGAFESAFAKRAHCTNNKQNNARYFGACFSRRKKTASVQSVENVYIGTSYAARAEHLYAPHIVRKIAHNYACVSQNFDRIHNENTQC